MRKGISAPLIFGVIVAVILLGAGVSAIHAVSPGHRGVLLTYGAVEDRVLGEGLQIVTPFVNDVVEMSVQTQKYSATSSAASRDLQDVKTEVTLNYHLDPANVNKVYQTLGTEFEDRIIQPTIQESVKASTAEFTAEELVTKRPAVKERVEQAVRNRLTSNHIIVEQVSLTDFSFSPSFSEAIERKQVSVQEALKAENDLKTIEVVARQKVAQAQGEADATIAKAKAESEAITITGAALRQNPQLVQLEAVKKWDGKLPVQMLGSAPVPFLDLTATP